MRRALFSAILAVLAALPAGADQAAEESLEKFFTGWFSVCPGTRVSARALPEIAIPGYPAYRVERQCELKNRGQSVVALVHFGVPSFSKATKWPSGSSRATTSIAALDGPSRYGGSEASATRTT